MSVNVPDKFTGEIKTLYNGKEKFDYHLARVQKNSGATLGQRIYSSGWLKSNRNASKEFKRNNPGYIRKTK